MRKLDLNKHWFEILIVVSGALMIAVSFLADAVGLGGQAGFGGKQTVLAVLGSGMLLAAGVILRARRRGWVPKITIFEDTQSSVANIIEDKPLYKQLTCEAVAPSSIRSMLTTVLGTVFVVLVVNFAALWYLDNRVADPWFRLVAQKWDILENMQTPSDWLILGDSSGAQGVVPEILESNVGGSAVNLCTNSFMTLLHDALILDAYTDKFGPPKNVLIVHAHEIVSEELVPVAYAQVPLPWGVSSRYRFSPALLGVEEQVQIAMARYVPLYFRNTELKKAILNSLMSPGNLFRNEVRFDLSPKGYLRMVEPYPEHVEEDAKAQLEFAATDLVISDASRIAIEHIIALADQHDINVYIVNAPLYEKLYENRLFRERRLAKISEWWSNIDHRSDNIHYIPTISTFPLYQLQEVDHVIDDAAEIYTEELSWEIMKLQKRKVVESSLGEY